MINTVYQTTYIFDQNLLDFSNEGVFSNLRLKTNDFLFLALSFSYPGSPVQAVFHYSNEFLIGELVIMINIKDFENGVNKVTCELLPRGHVHCSRKLIC